MLVSNAHKHTNYIYKFLLFKDIAFFFSWQLNILKNAKKLGLTRRAMQQKGVHILMRADLWDKPFFPLGLSMFFSHSCM